MLDVISPGPKFSLPGHIVSARTSQMIWSIEVPDNVEFVDNQAGFYNLNSSSIIKSRPNTSKVLTNMHI